VKDAVIGNYDEELDNAAADQLTLFDKEAPVFPAEQYQRLIGGGDPFRAPKGTIGKKAPGTESELWFPYDIPDDWNGVIVIAYHPTFHEMRRLEQHAGEFIGVMTGEAYTLLTNHILKKIGLHWEKSIKANLVPWYVSPKGRVSQGEERYGFQFIDKLIEDYKPQLILSFGANIVPHLVNNKGQAGVTELQGQLISLPQYPHTQLICATNPANLINKVKWIHSWERTLRGGLLNWFNQHRPQKAAPPEFIIEDLEALGQHLRTIQDNHEEVVAIDTEFTGNDISDYKLLDIILATTSRTLNIHVREGRSQPVLCNPYDIAEDKGEVFIFPSEEAYKKWTPPLKTFRAYIDDTRWVFKGTQEELAAMLNRYLQRPEIKMTGHALKVDILQMLLFGVDLRRNIFVDTYDLAKVLDEGQPQGLEDLVQVYLGKENHKAAIDHYREFRGIKDGSYAMIPPEIRQPYGSKDGRRTFELVAVMLEEMRRQDQELRKREPQVYEAGATLENAYFQKKRKQMLALIEMELVGHPISLKRMGENIEWYDTRLEKLLAQTVDYIKTRLSIDEINPGSAAQLRRILFNHAPEGIGLYPLYSTEKPVREWHRAVREALYKTTKLEILQGGQKQSSEDKEKSKKLLDYIHQGYGSATFDLNDPKLRRLLESPESPILMTIPDREYPVTTASTNQESLEMLAEKDPLCEKLNDCRSIATLANNYCRKDGSWGQSRVKQFLESIDAEEEDDSQIMLFEMEATPVQKVEAETVKKRQKALSMAVNRDASILYTTYWGSLETHRLRTTPNVSAVPKGEADYVSKIIGEVPPHSIRGLEMAPYGWFMAEMDYAAAEVQRLAQVSGDPNMTEIMDDPTRDPHASLAREKDPELLGKYSDSEIKRKFKSQRDEAKPFTFGIPYQRGNEAMARSLNREAVRAKKPANHTAEGVAHIKNAYARLYSTAWEYLEGQMNRVIPQVTGAHGNTYFSHRGVLGYQVSTGGFRRRYLDPALVKVIFSQESKRDSELLRTLKDMRREASNWQIQHGVAIYIMEACNNWSEFRQRNPDVPIVMIDILHDSTRWLIHWTALSMAREILPRIMIEIPSNLKPRLRVDMKISYEWNGPDIKEPVPNPEQPKIRIPGLKYLGLDHWNDVMP
jgi:DNA polymerase I-like protein with 3'-5' exonuclease and polymerase domains